MKPRTLVLMTLVALATALALTPSASAIDILGCSVGLGGASCPL